MLGLPMRIANGGGAGERQSPRPHDDDLGALGSPRWHRPSVTRTRRPPVRRGSGAFEAVGASVACCCSPLPRQFRCLGFSLEGLVRILLALQAFYGLLVAVLHVLLLAPPVNEPRCDWIPGSGPWLELLDLQWSFRIRGNTGVGSWEQPLAQGTTPEGAREFGGSGNFAGTITGLVLGVITLLLAVVVELSICFSRNNGELKWVEKGWLAFTTLQVGGFCLCNLGKVQALCDHLQAMQQPPPRITNDAGAAVEPTGGIENPSQLFPQMSGHCGVLRMWYIEWNLMTTALACLGLLVCWSYINVRLQDTSRGGCPELGDYGGVDADSDSYSADI
mmetsp:Transcript_97244/g.216976  ORF Transcript_97244/g.216976 Transcript_97244/m.216976 type:complete len:333 (-) Transcript_97244:69-1067(-)